MCVVADITHCVADILHGASVISHCMASTFSNLPLMLHVQQQFLKFFQVFSAFQVEKYSFSQKCSKIGLVITFLLPYRYMFGLKNFIFTFELLKSAKKSHKLQISVKIWGKWCLHNPN